MLRILSVFTIIASVGLVVWGVLTFYDENLKIGRMWETAAIKPHEEPILAMASHTIPFDGGEALYRQANPAMLKASFDMDTPEVIASGKVGYQYFCVQCHGNHHDGNGTVGQSFAPLPGDLRSPKVQAMPAGQVFYEISYGYPGGRQPALATTIAVEDRWKIVAYIQSLGAR